MPPRTLRHPERQTEIERRIRALRPDSPRQWGRMSPHQAICHLSDALRAFLGDIPAPPRFDNWFTRSVIRPFALRGPFRWPRGYRTSPGFDQAAGEGTPPEEFDADRDELLELHERFAALPGLPPVSAHPAFGPFTRDEWMIWAYLHADHHLRQFGV